MARAQTDLNLPNDPKIKSEASPVDQFSVPNVGAPSIQGASDLAALAKALSHLEPKIGQIFDARHQAFTQASRLQASRDRATQRIESMASLQEAVKSGKIAESDNPWYMATMEEEVGRITARNALAKVWNDYEMNQELRGSNDVTKVEQFFRDRFNQAIADEGGGSIWAVGAMAKVLEEGKADLVQRHVQVRSRERVEEREVTARTEIAQLLGGLNGEILKKAREGDPVAQAKIGAAKGAMQDKLNELLQTVNRVHANKWIKDAIMDHAVLTEDPHVARELIESLTKEDGSPVINDEDRVALKNLEERVLDLKIQRLQRDEYLRKHEDNIKRDTIAQALLDKMAIDPNFDFSTEITPADRAKWGPRLSEMVNQWAVSDASAKQTHKNIGRENARHELISKIGGDVVSGVSTLEQKQSFYRMLVELGGHNDANTILRTAGMLENLPWPEESDPEAFSQVLKGIAVGDIKGPEGIDSINGVAGTRKLSRRDFMSLQFWMLNDLRAQERNTDRGDLQFGLRRLDDLITNKRLAPDNQGGDGMEYRSHQELLDDDVLRDRKSKAEREFHQRYTAMIHSGEWAKLSEADKTKRVNELLDDTARRNGGFDEINNANFVGKRVEAERKAFEDERKRLEAKNAGAEVAPADSLVDTFAKTGDETLKAVDQTAHEALRAVKLSPEQVVPKWNTWDRRYWGPKVSAGEPFAKLLQIRDQNPPSRTEAKMPEAVAAIYPKLRRESLIQARHLAHTIVADDVPGRLKFILANVQRQGFATSDDRKSVSFLWGKLREYAMIRYYAGYDVDEVKRLAKGSHMLVPMFATFADVDRHGVSTAAELGLDENAAAEFISRQKKLLFLRDKE